MNDCWAARRAGGTRMPNHRIGSRFFDLQSGMPSNSSECSSGFSDGTVDREPFVEFSINSVSFTEATPGSQEEIENLSLESSSEIVLVLVSHYLQS